MTGEISRSATPEAEPFFSLTIEASERVGSSVVALDLATGLAKTKKQYLLAEGAGHYGIFSGRRWRDVVYPEVMKFILAHNDLGTKKKAAAKSAAKPTAKRAVKAVAKKAPARKK